MGIGLWGGRGERERERKKGEGKERTSSFRAASVWPGLPIVDRPSSGDDH